MRKHNRGFDSTTFKVIGVVVIFILILFICDPARGAEVEGPNAYDYVHELVNGDFGLSNNKRDILVNDLDFAITLIKYTTNRIENFDSVNGLHNLELRKAALLELINKTKHIHTSVIDAIIIFVKNHKGI
jgi:hypothetical protein